MAQFILYEYVHKGGIKPYLYHSISLSVHIGKSELSMKTDRESVFRGNSPSISLTRDGFQTLSTRSTVHNVKNRGSGNTGVPSDEFVTSENQYPVGRKL